MVFEKKVITKEVIKKQQLPHRGLLVMQKARVANIDSDIEVIDVNEKSSSTDTKSMKTRFKPKSNSDVSRNEGTNSSKSIQRMFDVRMDFI